MFFNKKKNPIELLAIGDIAIDAFIRIKEAESYCDLKTDECKLCFNFGDKVPYEFVEVVKAVGNSANAAVSASKLGVKSAVYAYIGDDINGIDCKKELEEKGVSTKYLFKDRLANTNYHYVLWYQDERTILVKHSPFKYDLKIDDEPKWIYLTSLGESTEEFHSQIATYLQLHRNVKLAFQPGTFQMRMGVTKLKRIYEHTEIFICNVEESKFILNEPNEKDIKVLLKKMAQLGPKIVVITDGKKGAYTFDSNKYLFMPVYPDIAKPYERTGAGDAFASTLVAEIIKGKSLEDALRFAPVNSMSVVQKIGAQKGLLKESEIEEYLKKAPEDYKVREI